MTEREFHAARRMFLAAKGTVLVAPESYPYTHAEWLGEVFGPDADVGRLIADNTRGYVLDGRLVAYRGQDFSHRVDHAAVAAALAVFDRAPWGVTEIGFGAVAGPNQPWEPRHLMPAADYYSLSAGAKALASVAPPDDYKAEDPLT